jgi:transcriptional regulator with XRE-family HTH domain
MRLNGWALRAIRQAQVLSGSECARRVGVSQAQWSNWERGVRDATAARVLGIAAVLGVDYRALLVDPGDAETEALRAAAGAGASARAAS